MAHEAWCSLRGSRELRVRFESAAFGAGLEDQELAPSRCLFDKGLQRQFRLGSKGAGERL